MNAHTTHKLDRITGKRQFGIVPSGARLKGWARKLANKASRKAARLALSQEN